MVGKTVRGLYLNYEGNKRSLAGSMKGTALGQSGAIITCGRFLVWPAVGPRIPPTEGLPFHDGGGPFLLARVSFHGCVQ